MGSETIVLSEKESRCFPPQSFTAYNAFQDQLRTLCLKEFPCGIGNWRAEECRNPRLQKSQFLKKGNTKGNTQNRFSSTLRDYGADRETTEALDELVTSKYSPWKVDYSWSEDAKTLREIAVNSPEQINDAFILKHFRTMRIVDRGVTEVDSHFSEFKNLENLILSANLLQSVNSRNLPRKLKTLELFGNQIDDLSELCWSPLPQLIHLGLGHNNLNDTGSYISGQFWSELLSLDIGRNNLVNLKGIIDTLETLPKLRSLILIGNPICLVPAYRGYTIDRLRKLNSLDDLPVSADEKHSNQGLANVTGNSLDTAGILIKVPFIRGLPAPEEIQNPDEQPEFPRVSRKYFVQFMFLHDQVQPSNLPQKTDDNSSTVADNQSPQYVENLVFGQSAETAHSPVNSDIHVQAPSDSTSPLPDLISPSQEHPMKLENPNASALVPIKTTSSDWMEDMQLNWVDVITRSNLLALRDFTQEGMMASVMEEKVLSYPAPDNEASGEMVSTGKGKKKQTVDLKKGKPPSKVKERDLKNKSMKGVKKNDDKKKKKKGEPNIDLVHSLPEYRTIASFCVPLASFLEGDYMYEMTYSENVAQSHPSSKSPSPERGNQKSKKDKEKPKSADKKKDKSGKGKEGKEKKRNVKGKVGKGKPGISVDEDETPRSLEVHVTVKLHHWKTSADQFKSDEDFLTSA